MATTDSTLLTLDFSRLAEERTERFTGRECVLETVNDWFRIRRRYKPIMGDSPWGPNGNYGLLNMGTATGANELRQSVTPNLPLAETCATASGA